MILIRNVNHEGLGVLYDIGEDLEKRIHNLLDYLYEYDPQTAIDLHSFRNEQRSGAHKYKASYIDRRNFANWQLLDLLEVKYPKAYGVFNSMKV